MRTGNLKIISSVAIAALLLLDLILWLILGQSRAFFFLASCDAAVIFVILIRVVIRHTSDCRVIIEAKRIRIVAAAPAIILVILVVLLSIRLGFCATFFLIAALDIVVIFVFFSWVCVQRVMARRRLRMQAQLISEVEEVHVEEYRILRKAAGLPTEFRYQELQAATDNFQTPIGRGGSGSVFKGILDDGSAVAVKRIEGEVRGEREFRTEITIIASLQHINLVRFLGYCLTPNGHRFLVYEYIQNGSLDAWIFPRNAGDERCLPWALRYQIAKDVSRALAYLHHDCRLRILHLDVKPENILLDEGFRAHVADFGISRLMERDECRIVTTVRGTRGYLAPEWFLDDGISEKTDVYSFGLVLLELVGGQRNVRVIGDCRDGDERTYSYFPKMVSEKLREGKLMEVVDERLVTYGNVDEKEVTHLVHVALWCIQDKADLRPSMAQVVDMLEGHVAVSVPPETRMFMVDLLAINRNLLDDTSQVLLEETDVPLMSAFSVSVSFQSGR